MWSKKRNLCYALECGRMTITLFSWSMRTFINSHIGLSKTYIRKNSLQWKRVLSKEGKFWNALINEFEFRTFLVDTADDLKHDIYIKPFWLWNWVWSKKVNTLNYRMLTITLFLSIIRKFIGSHLLDIQSGWSKTCIRNDFHYGIAI